MRILGALKADIVFQFKQGFYVIYVMMTLVYMIAAGRLPDNIKDIVVPLVIFSDPSVVGLFFIGGIIMLEKTQGVFQFVRVTPLKTIEYVMSKVLSLTLLALTAGLAISFTVYGMGFNVILLSAGIILTSVFFTLYGFVILPGCRTVNQYMIKMIPYMLVMMAPCVSLLDFKYSWIPGILPGAAGLKLVYGAFEGMAVLDVIVSLLSMLIFNFLILMYVLRIFNGKIASGGEE
jgi:fluoroquinolone transport system permease protein